jgi:hypothetical protein
MQSNRLVASIRASVGDGVCSVVGAGDGIGVCDVDGVGVAGMLIGAVVGGGGAAYLYEVHRPSLSVLHRVGDVHASV